MAKQSGIHQIKGKIGEHSYYRQTGVSGGLIRSINQGLSARVKADAAYANTRLNNQEFGAAANTAALLGQMVTPKFRPMILPFSQSKMAKEVLHLARENSQNWGQRTVSSSQTAQLAETLAAQSKRDLSEFATVSISRNSASEVNVNISGSVAQATLLMSLGVDKVLITTKIIDFASGQWDVIGGIMTTGYFNVVDSASANETLTSGTGFESDNDLNVDTFVPAPNHAGHQLCVVVLMPVRTINNVEHILQEYCSFTAAAIPAAQ